MHKHSHVNCFVPPHILKNIATKGTPRQKNLAIDTLKLSAQMRGQRQALADFTPATFRVAAGGKDRVVYDAKNGSSLPGTVVRREGEDPTADDPDLGCETLPGDANGPDLADSHRDAAE